MFYTTWDIIPKTLLEIIFDVFILVAKVIYSVPEYRRKNFWKNRLQSYRSKVWRVFIWIFCVVENSYASFPYCRKVTSSPWSWYYYPKISSGIRALILVISLYVGASRWKPIEGMSSFCIHEGVLYSLDWFFSDRVFLE